MPPSDLLRHVFTRDADSERRPAETEIRFPDPGRGEVPGLPRTSDLWHLVPATVPQAFCHPG